MANSILQMIANPVTADPAKSFEDSYMSSRSKGLQDIALKTSLEDRQYALEDRAYKTKQRETSEASKSKMLTAVQSGNPQAIDSGLQEYAVSDPQAAKAIADTFTGMDAKRIQQVAFSVYAAGAVGGDEQNAMLEQAKQAMPQNHPLLAPLQELMNISAGKEKDTKILQTIGLFQGMGLLPKPTTPQKTQEQLERELKLEERNAAVNERNVSARESEIKQGPTLAKSSLGKLIAERDALPANSPNRAAYDKAISDETDKAGGTKERPRVAKLMAKGYFPSGRITAPMLDAMEAAAVEAEKNGKPLTVEDLYDMEFKAMANRATGATSGGRLTVARKENIAVAYGLLDDMEKTNAKLNYSNVSFLGSLEKWKNGQLNDPTFTEYMTQRADALFVLGNALKQNGLTDKAIEIEEEAANPKLPPQAFKAWVKVQRKALDRSAEEMNKDFKFDIKKSGESSKEQPKNNDPLGIR